MQWKRPVDHFLSPPPGREGFMFAPCCCRYAAVGGAPELLNLLYASGGADGYIAWANKFVYANCNALLLKILSALLTTACSAAAGWLGGQSLT